VRVHPHMMNAKTVAMATDHWTKPFYYQATSSSASGDS